MTRCARGNAIFRKADGGREERAAISEIFQNDQEAGAYIGPASWVLMGKLSPNKYQ
jgi:hypothetical protein